jgi:tRNA-modifying protein YgfZ
MNLRALYTSLGATLADDGIPLHFADLAREYQHALQHAVLLDRSHEGRLQIHGDSRFDFLNRMSTNKIVGLQPGDCTPTIFVNANARILERVLVCAYPDHLLLITEPGRNQSVLNLLQRQVFFHDHVQITDMTGQTAQFSLHGSAADTVIAHWQPDAVQVADLHSFSWLPGDHPVTAIRNKPYAGTHWTLIVPQDAAVEVVQSLLQAGKPAHLTLAGSLLFNLLRIRAGRPGRVELSQDYIPLELGLWDEVSFNKGCYTGQEIIARMESRSRLARTLVRLRMSEWVAAPAEIRDANGAPAGQLTSSVQAPDGEIFTMAVVRIAHIEPGTQLFVGSSKTAATVIDLIGKQPDFIQP